MNFFEFMTIFFISSTLFKCAKKFQTFQHFSNSWIFFKWLTIFEFIFCFQILEHFLNLWNFSSSWIVLNSWIFFWIREYFKNPQRFFSNSWTFFPIRKEFKLLMFYKIHVFWIHDKFSECTNFLNLENQILVFSWSQTIVAKSSGKKWAFNRTKLAGNHSILALWCHMSSFLWYISTRWSLSFISKCNGPDLAGSLRRVSNSRFTHLISFCTLPKVLLLQLARSLDNVVRFLRILSSLGPGCVAFQLDVIVSCHDSCASRIVS